MSTKKIAVYDTTLRDGAQAEGVSFSAATLFCVNTKPTTERRPMNLRIVFSRLVITTVSVLLAGNSADAERFANYTINAKYAQTTDAYFPTPQLQAAKAYWEVYKIVDSTNPATMSLDDQVGFAAGTQTADVIVPDTYTTNNPIGILIYFSASDSAYMPVQYEKICSNLYLIGASADMAGNSQHDMSRIARGLDLVASLQTEYNADPHRVYVSGFSGGALIASLCGLFYPDVFKGAAPCEHIIYWPTICDFLSLEDFQIEAARNFRWNYIRGLDSYAAGFMNYRHQAWLGYGFDSRLTDVAGMAHSHPAADVLQSALEWVDAPVHRERAVNWTEWNQYAFLGHSNTNLHGPLADADGDGVSNYIEYVFGLSPLRSDPESAAKLLQITGRQCSTRYRLSANDINFHIGVSSDLKTWDYSGTNVFIEAVQPLAHEISTVRFRNKADTDRCYFTCRFELLLP